MVLVENISMAICQQVYAVDTAVFCSVGQSCTPHIVLSFQVCLTFFDERFCSLITVCMYNVCTSAVGPCETHQL